MYMVTSPLGELDPNLQPIDLSEFLYMYSFHNGVLPYDDDLLEAMIKINSPIFDLFFPQDVVPQQEPSFLLLQNLILFILLSLVNIFLLVARGLLRYKIWVGERNKGWGSCLYPLDIMLELRH